MPEELIPTKIKLGESEITAAVPKFCVFVCNNGEDPHTPDIPEMTVEETLYHGTRVKKLHKDTLRLWNEIYNLETRPAIQEPNAADQIRALNSMGATHLMGMIDLCIKLREAGLSIHVKYPESMLHPKVEQKLITFFNFVKNIKPNEEKQLQMLRQMNRDNPQERKVDMNL